MALPFHFTCTLNLIDVLWTFSAFSVSKKKFSFLSRVGDAHISHITSYTSLSCSPMHFLSKVPSSPHARTHARIMLGAQHRHRRISHDIFFIFFCGSSSITQYSAVLP